MDPTLLSETTLPLDSDSGPESQDACEEQAQGAKLQSAFERRRQQLLRNQHLKQETVKIIESLLEGRADPDHLRRCVSLLSKNEYDDLNTERSLAEVCGYPLCDGRLVAVSSASRQKFKLDLRHKQVYLMEERVLFCSVRCLEASRYLRDQLSDEALWLRYKDGEGYEALYRQGSHIHFQGVEATRGVGQSTAQADSKQKCGSGMSTRESLSFPYIKEEQIRELQKAITCLTVTERDVTPASSSATASAEAVTTAAAEGEPVIPVCQQPRLQE